MIKTVSKWIEKILMKAGEANKLKVLLLAFTGVAASLIGKYYLINEMKAFFSNLVSFSLGGTTLHSGIGFKWGPDHLSMTKPKLDQLKKEIERVEAVIVDEMSMVSADYLYNLHKRLMELFDSKDDFGGRALMLVGDLLQLPPVKATAIFKQPKSDKNKIIHDMTDANGKNIGNLWDNFQVVVLKTNFRQGNGNPWTELLNRVRKGEATAEDIKVLESRRPSLLSQEEYDDATHVFFKNKDVYAHNLKMLRKLKTDMVEIQAKYNVPKASDFTPSVNEWGIVGDSNFSDNLQLKIGSRVMMVFNISINDLLVNGALGTVVGFELSSSGSVEAVIVAFDNPEAGRQQRRD